MRSCVHIYLNMLYFYTGYTARGVSVLSDEYNGRSLEISCIRSRVPIKNESLSSDDWTFVVCGRMLVAWWLDLCRLRLGHLSFEVGRFWPDDWMLVFSGWTSVVERLSSVVGRLSSDDSKFVVCGRTFVVWWTLIVYWNHARFDQSVNFKLV